MKCPHCGHETANTKWVEWNRKAAPARDSYFMCLQCGGMSEFTTHHTAKVLTAAQYSEIRNGTALMLLERLRARYLKRSQTEQKIKRK